MKTGLIERRLGPIAVAFLLLSLFAPLVPTMAAQTGTPEGVTTESTPTPEATQAPPPPIVVAATEAPTDIPVTPTLEPSSPATPPDQQTPETTAEPTSEPTARAEETATTGTPSPESIPPLDSTGAATIASDNLTVESFAGTCDAAVELAYTAVAADSALLTIRSWSSGEALGTQAFGILPGSNTYTHQFTGIPALNFGYTLDLTWDGPNDDTPGSIQTHVRNCGTDMVSLESVACDGTVVFTLAEGDWYYPYVRLSISTQLASEEAWTLDHLNDRFAPGTHTVQMNVRPGDYQDLTVTISTNDGGSTQTIQNCVGGGNPSLEPYRQISILSLTCDGLVTFEVSPGYQQGDQLLLTMRGLLEAGNEQNLHYLESLAFSLPGPGTHTIQAYIDPWYDQFTYHQYQVSLATYNYVDPFPSETTFNECTPADEVNHALSITNSFLPASSQYSNSPTYGLNLYTSEGSFVNKLEVRTGGSDDIDDNGVWNSSFSLPDRGYIVCPHEAIRDASIGDQRFVTSISASGADGSASHPYGFSTPCWAVDLSAGDRTISFSSTLSSATLVVNAVLVGEPFADPSVTWYSTFYGLTSYDLVYENGTASITTPTLVPGTTEICFFSDVSSATNGSVAVLHTVNGAPVDDLGCVSVTLVSGQQTVLNVESRARDVTSNPMPELSFAETVNLVSVDCDGTMLIDYELDAAINLFLAFEGTDGVTREVEGGGGYLYTELLTGFVEIPAGTGTITLEMPIASNLLKGYLVRLTDQSEFWDFAEVWNCDTSATGAWHTHTYTITDASCDGTVTWNAYATQRSGSSPRVYMTDLDTGETIHISPPIEKSTSWWITDRIEENYGEFSYQIPVPLDDYASVEVVVGVVNDQLYGPPTDIVSRVELPDCTQAPAENGTITVVLEPADLPAGAEVCLMSESVELCQDLPAPTVELPLGMLAFAQPANLVQITFDNVSPGLYRIILRAAGFQDLTIGEANLGADGMVETSPIPAETQEQLKPSDDFLSNIIALLIAILLEILAAYGL